MKSVWPEAIAVLLMSLTACASTQQPRCHSGEQLAVEDSLYFGQQTRNGVITNEEWARFLQDVVTPRFPSGLTVISDASGQWLSANGSLARESTRILQIVHPDNEANDALLAKVISEYKTQFHQESVLRVKVGACVAF
jgi:Protein of unknown function (DUF3574)